MLTIGYAPYKSINGYVRMSQKILSRYGRVVEVPLPAAMLEKSSILLKPRIDIAVINWFDSMVVSKKSGKPYLIGIIKFLVTYLFLKAISKKLVLVRHNHYPHHTKKEYGPGAARLIDRLEKLFDLIVSHAANNQGGERYYIPHPLYDVECRQKKIRKNVEKEYYVVFGRILPYKNLSALIVAFPANKNLVIAGACDDSAYLEKLVQLAKGRKIEIRAEYISDQEAVDLLCCSNGLIIPNADPNMIVSGSYFYAVSLGVPVFTMVTPFFKWVQERLRAPGLFIYDDVNSLCEGIVMSNDGYSSQEIIDYGKSNYDDDVCAARWKEVIDKTLSVR